MKTSPLVFPGNTDKPLIEAKNQEDTDTAIHALEAIEQYTIAFFDRYLKQQNNGLLEPAATPSTSVSLEQFKTATK